MVFSNKLALILKTKTTLKTNKNDKTNRITKTKLEPFAKLCPVMFKVTMNFAQCIAHL
jgi:hypothetical protein